MDYLHAFQKTDQQSRLEEVLDALNLTPQTVVDVACGIGNLSHQLGRKYPQAHFSLVDSNLTVLGQARAVAKSLCGEIINAEATNLPLPTNSYDLIFFWRTLLTSDDPERVFNELIRICKPGGRIFVSSLFNTAAEIDLYRALTKSMGVRFLQVEGLFLHLHKTHV